MRYFIEFSFNGTNYHGWQMQSNAITVESVLSRSISIKLNEQIKLFGASRTDTGVHAVQMFAHFDTGKRFIELDLVMKLNSFLPKDIFISSIFKVKDDVHARFSAMDRTYQYYISNKKNVFNSNLYIINSDLNISLMNKACDFLLGKKDFTSFAKKHSDTNNNICNVYEAYWNHEKSELVFTIKSNRFLRNMVRSIVGTLVQVGNQNLSIDSLNHIFDSRDRSESGFSVPAKGLFLTSINYPENIFK